MKNIIIAVFILNCLAFSSVNSVAVSPYIINGFSKTYSLWYSPTILLANYYNDSLRSNFGTDIRNLPLETERFNTIGTENKFALSFSIFALPIEIEESFLFRGRLRLDFNNKLSSNSNNLFENIAITTFSGISGSSLNLLSGLETNGHFQLYIGNSIGTRKLVDNKYSFELFTSPTYSFIIYSASVYMGNVGQNSTYEKFQRFVQEIDIPVSFRYIFEKRIVKISIKGGFGLKVPIPNDKIEFHKYSEINYGSDENINSLFIRHSYFSAFAEFGFHFGSKKYNQERRKQKEVLTIKRG